MIFTHRSFLDPISFTYRLLGSTFSLFRNLSLCSLPSPTAGFLFYFVVMLINARTASSYQHCYRHHRLKSLCSSLSSSSFCQPLSISSGSPLKSSTWEQHKTLPFKTLFSCSSRLYSSVSPLNSRLYSFEVDEYVTLSDGGRGKIVERGRNGWYNVLMEDGTEVSLLSIAFKFVGYRLCVAFIQFLLLSSFSFNRFAKFKAHRSWWRIQWANKDWIVWRCFIWFLIYIPLFSSYFLGYEWVCYRSIIVIPAKSIPTTNISSRDWSTTYA